MRKEKRSQGEIRAPVTAKGEMGASWASDLPREPCATALIRYSLSLKEVSMIAHTPTLLRG